MRDDGWLAAVVPGGFAMVMATGIVSIAARLLGFAPIGWALLAINAVLYPLLWCALLLRMIREPRAVLAELASHERGPSFLTMVAASAVLGSQLDGFSVATGLMVWLFGVAVALWVVLLYGFLAAVTLRDNKPEVHAGLSGSWLLLVVATESLAVLGVRVAVGSTVPGPLIFACLAAFLLGGMLYVLLISLILYRFVFMPMPAAALRGPWWINMGAVAIATLAGAGLMGLPTFDVHVAALRQVAGPMTAVFWATATFWIPLLVVLYGWRHAVRREPIRYEMGQWSIVFPLGMYTAATTLFARNAGVAFLEPIAWWFFWVALLAWGLTAFGAVRRAWRAFGECVGLTN